MKPCPKSLPHSVSHSIPPRAFFSFLRWGPPPQPLYSSSSFERMKLLISPSLPFPTPLCPTYRAILRLKFGQARRKSLGRHWCPEQAREIPQHVSPCIFSPPLPPLCLCNYASCFLALCKAAERNYTVSPPPFAHTQRSKQASEVGRLLMPHARTSERASERRNIVKRTWEELVAEKEEEEEEDSSSSFLRCIGKRGSDGGCGLAGRHTLRRAENHQ